MSDINPGHYLSNLYGRWEAKEIIPEEWYGNRRFDFEGHSFRGIEEYDKYLTQLYNNYMKFPPQGNRNAHTNNIYLR